MPPKWVKDKNKWERAKLLARDQYPQVKAQSERYYAIATGIYKKMGGQKNPSLERILLKYFVACAWCKKVKSRKTDRPVRFPYKFFTSHGACKACAKAEKAAALARKRANPSAADVYTEFHDFGPNRVRSIAVKSLKMGREQAPLGRLIEVVYASNKFDKKKRHYRHKFDAPPVLSFDPQTGLMHILPQRWRVTAAGIVG